MYPGLSTKTEHPFALRVPAIMFQIYIFLDNNCLIFVSIKLIVAHFYDMVQNLRPTTLELVSYKVAHFGGTFSTRAGCVQHFDHNFLTNNLICGVRVWLIGSIFDWHTELNTSLTRAATWNIVLSKILLCLFWLFNFN